MENISAKLSELKSKLADLYFEGWVDQDDSAFDQIALVRQQIRLLNSKIVGHYEKIVEPDGQKIRMHFLKELKLLSFDLKKKLPGSSRVADIDRVITLLESNADQWTKEKWLHLNRMCNRYPSMLRKPLYHYYASVDQVARKVGKEKHQRLRSEMDAFDLCTSGDIEQIMQAVWADWERYHSDSVEDLLADPVIRMFRSDPPEWGCFFNIRRNVLFTARQAAQSLSQGMARPASELSAVERFHLDVLKRGAEKRASFNRAIKTLDQKQYQDALHQALFRMKNMENNGDPCFPVIKALAETKDEHLIEINGCGFDDVCLWAGKKLGHFLETYEREELMIMFMNFHDYLMKKMNV